jgi:hypothetical protein
MSWMMYIKETNPNRILIATVHTKYRKSYLHFLVCSFGITRARAAVELEYALYI